jgi:hypothetical protein
MKAKFVPTDFELSHPKRDGFEVKIISVSVLIPPEGSTPSDMEVTRTVKDSLGWELTEHFAIDPFDIKSAGQVVQMLVDALFEDSVSPEVESSGELCDEHPYEVNPDKYDPSRRCPKCNLTDDEHHDLLRKHLDRVHKLKN